MLDLELLFNVNRFPVLKVIIIITIITTAIIYYTGIIWIVLDCINLLYMCTDLIVIIDERNDLSVKKSISK